MNFTEDDLGNEIDFEYYKNERVVKVFCSVCSAECIAPIVKAGGFLARHEYFHTWEFKQVIEQELIA